jgi:drug/metabolite transporter (DMT)-like permease
MPIIALAAALGASTCWAFGYLIAHRPATQLGAFEFTRTQLISSFALLVVIVTVLNGWQSVTWVHWPSFVAASLIGVVFTNLAMIACLRRGGPRRMQLLASMSAPFAALLGFLFLGESMSPQKLIGVGLAFSGLLLAILSGRRGQHRIEAVHGSLAVVIALGLFAAICSAVGLIVLKPALLAGTDPLAATALRTGGGALVISVVALWPAAAFESPIKRTPNVVLRAILPGFVGYIAAVSLQLYALRSYDAGIVAVLSSMAPVVMLPMIWIMSGDPPPLSAWLGAFLVVLGAGIIFAG